MSHIFKSKLSEIGIELDKKQEQQFDLFYRILIEWNQVMNLTTITDEEEVNEKHFIDSLSLVKAIDIKSVKTVMDIGTGAGFPGIPLKIVFPQLEIVLLDSLNKRVKFLNTVIDMLGLKGIRAVHGRAEDYAKDAKYRECFDLCVSRAVANLSTLSEYCLPYVRINGYFIPYKAGEIEEELEQSKKAVHTLGGNIEETVKFKLPGSEIGRSFVKIKKTNVTQKNYPRKAGLPAKEPM